MITHKKLTTASLSQFYSNTELKRQDKVQFNKGSGVVLIRLFLDLNKAYYGSMIILQHCSLTNHVQLFCFFLCGYFRIPKIKHSLIICCGDIAKLISKLVY